ncbi:GTP cyclohydrolase 1 type 2/Nif3 [Xylariaceae sp. FL0016]|nr:GTP cyclohydrolase 1 type 2/Nif3 [Xylariaceae sp. FL0016]
MAATKYKLVFRVPNENAEAVKAAVFSAGAGRYPGPGGYTECAWQTSGTGQFRPGDAASPHIGKAGALEKVDEVRVETLCVGLETARKAVGALIKAHPYEEPGYEVCKIEDIEPIMPE